MLNINLPTGFTPYKPSAPLVLGEDTWRSGYSNLGSDDDTLFNTSSSQRLINAQAGNDTIVLSGTGDATVFAGSGADQIWGAEGDNVIYGGTGNDQITGGTYGEDKLYGGDGNDTIFGDNDATFGWGNDQIFGGNGDDAIVGGRGSDDIYGGAGADTFKYRLVSESTLSDTDTIMDYSFVQGDRIDLSQIDANQMVAGNQGFSVVGGPSTQAGTMWFETIDATTERIFLNVDGGGADMAINVQFDAASTSHMMQFLL